MNISPDRRAELRANAETRQKNMTCTVTCLLPSDELLALLDAAEEAARLRPQVSELVGFENAIAEAFGMLDSDANTHTLAIMAGALVESQDELCAERDRLAEWAKDARAFLRTGGCDKAVKRERHDLLAACPLEGKWASEEA